MGQQTSPLADGLGSAGLWPFARGGVAGGAGHAADGNDPLIDFACLQRLTFRGFDLGRVIVSYRHYGFAIPAAADVSGGFRIERVSIRNAGADDVCGESGDEVGDDAGFAAVGIPCGADRERADLGGADCGCWDVLSPKATTPKAAMITVLFFHGLSRSMQFTALNTLAFVDIPKTLMSSATSFAAVVQQMGMGLGVAVGAVALRGAGWLRGERARHVIADGFPLWRSG